VQQFTVKGVITEMGPDKPTFVVKHEPVANYMPAMTMPFHVRDAAEIAGLRPGDAVTFRLHVQGETSWADHVTSTLSTAGVHAADPATNSLQSPSLNISAIPDFALTNELGERVTLHQFQGQAVAMTFFFTRCPIPEYCPRLSRTFAEASQLLSAAGSGVTNWHLLSISFDPLDRPEVLRAYAKQYNYNPKRWTFLTGDPAAIRALTRGFGLAVTPDGAGLSHDFRTVVFDANGQFQTMWPFGGDTTKLLVRELTKAASVQPKKGDLAAHPVAR
jgi:protein SCO1/2